MQERSLTNDENNNNKHDIDHFSLNNMKLNHILLVSYIYIYTHIVF